jgi:hypothetical protein
MDRLGRFLVFFALVFAAPLALGASYFVESVKTSDANPELTRSLTSLVQTSVSNAGERVAESAADADYELRSELIRLGGAYVLTVTKVRRGSPVYSSHQKAATVEDLDDATDRAVRAAILSTPAKKDVRLGEVKPQEEDQIRRRIKSRSATYLGFGPAGLINMNESRLAYDLAIGHYWEVAPHASIKAVGDIVGSGDMKTYFALAQLGLNYYFTDEDSSPYFGAGLGFGGSASASTSATTIGGFAANIGLGYEFFRTSNAEFDVFVGYSAIFGNNTIGQPGAFGLRIGVLF